MILLRATMVGCEGFQREQKAALVPLDLMVLGRALCSLNASTVISAAFFQGKDCMVICSDLQLKHGGQEAST